MIEQRIRFGSRLLRTDRVRIVVIIRMIAVGRVLIRRVRMRVADRAVRCGARQGVFGDRVALRVFLLRPRRARLQRRVLCFGQIAVKLAQLLVELLESMRVLRQLAFD